ncbi:A24 family peptidase [Suttonella sp. R2A3]|uniref:prepilin peptidase n=1 Tax=Suttonella sp. R2A3 TaxID=2908648 RepID=UPI001F3DF152|nr:A24 family peptidase [Suttonella sp. R2A3]UJF23709.1 A24 family peptidase [Suttonella sp. R2A3]
MLSIEFLQSAPGIILVGLLGLVVGSFLNVVIYRLPHMMERDEQAYARAVVEGVDPSEVKEGRFNLFYPPSACPHCGHGIRAWQNIPILSYLVQRGRCTSCGESISLRYLVVELLTMVLSILVVLQYPEPMQLGFALIFTWTLIALVFIDAESQLLPDILTLPLMWLGIIAGLLGLFVSLEESVIGAMVGYMSLWVVYWAFKLVTGREGMGYGDFKLLAALCAFQGAYMLPIILFMAAICGLIFALISRLGRGIPMAFGPYLAAAGWLVFMYGNSVEALLYGSY